MKKNKNELRKLQALHLAVVFIFCITLVFGIFRNPKFDMYDFLFNLSTELIGLLIALFIVDRYIKHLDDFKRKKSINEQNIDECGDTEKEVK